MSIYDKIGSVLLQDHCPDCEGLLVVEPPTVKNIEGTVGGTLRGNIFLLFTCMNCNQMFYAAFKEIDIKPLGDVEIETTTGRLENAIK